MKLKVFRELEFYGDEKAFLLLIERIEQKLNEGWERSREDEKFMANSLTKKPYCFRCSKSGERESALLWMMEKYYEDKERPYETLYVANIVPTESNQLNYDQYNYILKEFYERFAKPTADELQIDSKMTSDEKGIDNWVSPKVEEKLIKFSKLANKNTGSAHPSDEERWFEFIIFAHKENSTLGAETLQRWLTEIENWSDDAAWNLVAEYESARKLLKQYDKERYDN